VRLVTQDKTNDVGVFVQMGLDQISKMSFALTVDDTELSAIFGNIVSDGSVEDGASLVRVAEEGMEVDVGAGLGHGLKIHDTEGMD